MTESDCGRARAFVRTVSQLNMMPTVTEAQRELCIRFHVGTLTVVPTPIMVRTPFFFQMVLKLAYEWVSDRCVKSSPSVLIVLSIVVDMLAELNNAMNNVLLAE